MDKIVKDYTSLINGGNKNDDQFRPVTALSNCNSNEQLKAVRSQLMNMSQVMQTLAEDIKGTQRISLRNYHNSVENMRRIAINPARLILKIHN